MIEYFMLARGLSGDEHRHLGELFAGYLTPKDKCFDFSAKDVTLKVDRIIDISMFSASLLTTLFGHARDFSRTI
jgi:hypothetical protein